jgi:hypothetical protein
MMNAAVMNDELKTTAFQFIVPHSALIVPHFAFPGFRP